MAHENGREKDDEFEDFENRLERLTQNASETWKEQNPEETKSTEQDNSSAAKKSADDVVGSSQNDSSSDGTAEQVEQVESENAFDAEEQIAKFTDEEFETIKASQAPLAASDPSLLASILEGSLADEKINVNKLVIVPTTTVDPDGNPGWQIIGLAEIAKTAKELGLEPQLLQAYSRDMYWASTLTLDQICHVKDNIEVALALLHRRKSAFHTVGTERIKGLTKSKRKQYESDINFVPSTHSEVRARARKRSETGTAAPAKPKGLGVNKQKELVQAIKLVYKTPAKLAQALETEGELTPEIAMFLKKLEAEGNGGDSGKK